MVQQQEGSEVTESHTEDGNDEPLADEDDMEEEVVGEPWFALCFHQLLLVLCLMLPPAGVCVSACACVYMSVCEASLFTLTTYM